jgi:GAF domain-containing protein
MGRREDQDLQDIVRSAVAEDGIESAAIFVVQPGSTDLRLAASAGIEGPAIERLVAAVSDQSHPIAKAMTDDGPTFDVQPMAPGGPALRSHLPIVVERQDARSVVGVLAVAHDRVLTEADRQVLIRLAATAAASVAPNEGAGSLPDPGSSS